jgi:hypothetical protein
VGGRWQLYRVAAAVLLPSGLADGWTKLRTAAAQHLPPYLPKCTTDACCTVWRDGGMLTGSCTVFSTFSTLASELCTINFCIGPTCGFMMELPKRDQRLCQASNAWVAWGHGLVGWQKR